MLRATGHARMVRLGYYKIKPAWHNHVTCARRALPLVSVSAMLALDDRYFDGLAGPCLTLLGPAAAERQPSGARAPPEMGHIVRQACPVATMKVRSSR